MIKNFNNFPEHNTPVTELDYSGDNMYKTSAVFNLLGNLIEDGNALSDIIKDTLTPATYDMLFKGYASGIRNKFDLLNFFTTTVINKNRLMKMFTDVAVQKGADWEDEYVVTLSINDRVVLLLASPERGTMIRIQDEDHNLPFSELTEIIKTLCVIYNERL